MGGWEAAVVGRQGGESGCDLPSALASSPTLLTVCVPDAPLLGVPQGGVS